MRGSSAVSPKGRKREEALGKGSAKAEGGEFETSPATTKKV